MEESLSHTMALHLREVNIGIGGFLYFRFSFKGGWGIKQTRYHLQGTGKGLHDKKKTFLSLLQVLVELEFTSDLLQLKF